MKMTAGPAYPSVGADATATCPFCDEVIRLVIAKRQIVVENHRDIYPTRICEGSGRVVHISNGRVSIDKERRE